MFDPLPSKFDFPQAEKRILEFWDQHEIFAKSIANREGCPRFVFYEGPPTANGMPHPGHALTRVIKDVFPRYKTMCGFLSERKAGWDTHGLPVEREVEKELGLQGKEGIEKYGVEKFILKCINSVWRYTREWEELTRRLAYWIDLKNAYATYHQSYVESVWWGLKTLFDHKDADGRPNRLLYQAHKVVWWWAQGGTALSSGEVGEGYKTVDDPSVFVKFPLINHNGGTTSGANSTAMGVSGTATDGSNLTADASNVGNTPNMGGIGGTSGQGGTEGMGGTGGLGGTGVPPVSPISPAHRATGPLLNIRRRYLPHWEAGGSTYFITFRTRQGELSPAERDETLSAMMHFDGDRYLLHAAVVMPDHVHLLVTPLEKAPGQWWPLPEILHSLKSYTAHAIAKQRGAGQVWMEEYFDRIIRAQEDFDEKQHYILSNPAKRGLPEDYSWVWLEDSHIGQKQENGRDARTTLAGAAYSISNLPDKVSLLVWTTTPWTLLSNHFAAVHPDLDYALVHDAEGDEYLFVANALVDAISKKVKRELEPLFTCKGSDIVGQRYTPPFEDVYYNQPMPTILPRVTNFTYETLNSFVGSLAATQAHRNLGEAEAWHITDKSFTDRLTGKRNPSLRSVGWRVLAAPFVSTESGAGLVHLAPAFGEIDFDVLQKERQNFVHGWIDLPVLCAVNPDGTFNEDAPPQYRGRWVKDCDKDIIRELKERKTPWGTPLLYHQEQIRHEYPFCPRAENDALIQYARRGWFVRTSQFKEEFLKNNNGIYWLPDHIKEGRFGDFLRNNVDWALSRERYWGTPLPIWVCEKSGEMEAIGSFAELKAKPGATDVTPEHPNGFWSAKVAEHRDAGEEFPEHLRVHKPYIDAWTYDSPYAKGARMRRVPEVIDCWWDAGSMPFAQWGYPHADGSQEKLAHRFPADFISEAIDQTRGWFYALLAINTLLFANQQEQGKNRAQAELAVSASYPLPFRACIVLGHIAGEDGLKMSKRLRNYKEPTYIFDAYGADAMRWYFLSSQSPWTSVRFQEAAIRDSQREFLVKLYNVLSFFTIYANIDGFNSRPIGGGLPMAWRPTTERSELDRWIVTELHCTVREVRAAMDRFENYPAAQRLNDFVDALSNWYIRRSRDRFWRKVEQPVAGSPGAKPTASDQEKWDAYHTLYGCLLTTAMLVAPFTPFFAEMMYQVLLGSWKNADAGSANAAGGPSDPFAASSQLALPISVHLCNYPRPEDIRYCDEALSQEMDMVREIASLGRAARAASTVKEAKKVRQPLARVEVILAKAEHVEWLESHKPLIAEELNVKEVEFTADADHYVSYQVKANFKALGAKYRQLAPKIGKALEALADPAAARRALSDSGKLTLTVDGQAVELTPEEVEIRLSAKPGWSAAQGRVGVVVLSTEISDTLREEGLVREFIHYVQALRKDMDLPYEARVALHVDGSAELVSVLKRFEPVIREECLANSAEYGKLPENAAAQEIDVEGHKTRLALTQR